MTLSPERDSAAPSGAAPLAETLEEVLRFGAQLLRAGGTAFRVRQLMGVVARGMGVDALSIQLGLGSITASGQRGSERATLMCEVGAPGVNTRRIGALKTQNLGPRTQDLPTSPPSPAPAPHSARSRTPRSRR